MLDRVTSPAVRGSIYLRDDLSLDRAVIFRRAHQAARGELAHQTSRYQAGKCSLEPDSYRVIFRDKLAREMGAAVEARQHRQLCARAATDPTLRARMADFADQVNAHGKYAI